MPNDARSYTFDNLLYLYIYDIFDVVKNRQNPKGNVLICLQSVADSAWVTSYGFTG
jgi:hypothetical protein